MSDGAVGINGVESVIGRLTGTGKVGFELLPAEKKTQATNLLRVSTTRQGDKIAVHAVLSDGQQQSILKLWDGLYAPSEWKYVREALAGVVSSGLHLTPLSESTTMNEQARSHFQAGLLAIRQEATLVRGLKELETAQSLDGDSAVAWAGLAEGRLREYFATNDPKWLEPAKEAATQAMLRSSDTGIGHRVSSEFYALEKDFDTAEIELLRAVELEPGNSENYRLLGDTYDRRNEADKALRAYKRAVEIEPGYFRNQYKLGRFYLTQGRYKDAVEHLSETVRLAPDFKIAPSLLAQAYSDTGQFERAQQTLKKSGEAWDAEEQYQWATILMYQHKDAEAIPYLLKAIKQSPNEAFWMNLDIAYQQTGQPEAALQAAQGGLSLADQHLIENPKDADVRAFLGYFSARLGQAQRAESEAAQALKLAPHQLDVVWVAVPTYELLNKRDEALEVLRTSAPPEMLEDIKRWPVMADLSADSRFIKLTAANAVKKEQ